MLKSENEGEKDRNIIVQAVEWWLMVLVLFVQRPDIWRQKIDIILITSVTNVRRRVYTDIVT
jgi:hypothetical protein